MVSREQCAVLVPVASTIEPETMDGLQVLASRGYPVRTLRGCSQVDLARSILASEAVRDGFAETFWIDSDIVFDPNDVDRLRAHRHPVMAGLYVKKGRQEFACKWKEGTESVTFGPDGGIVEMHYVGMGFTFVMAGVYLCIERACKLPECGGAYDPARPIVPYFLPTIITDRAGKHCYLSEDYAFCHRARSANFSIMADTTVNLEHVGRKRYGWADLKGQDRYDWLKINFKEAAPEQATEPETTETTEPEVAEAAAPAA